MYGANAKFQWDTLNKTVHVIFNADSTFQSDNAAKPYYVTIDYDLGGGQSTGSDTFQMMQTSSSRFEKTLVIPNTVDLGGNLTVSINNGDNEMVTGYYSSTLQVPALNNGYIPVRTPSAYMIPNFQRLHYPVDGEVEDLDFINVQALSFAQAAEKCRTVEQNQGSTMQVYLNGKEYTATAGTNFYTAMGEIARVIEFAVEEVRNQQQFELANLTFVRDLP